MIYCFAHGLDVFCNEQFTEELSAHFARARCDVQNANKVAMNKFTSGLFTFSFLLAKLAGSAKNKPLVSSANLRSNLYIQIPSFAGHDAVNVCYLIIKI